MESDLQARDRIGVQDFVLLEDFRSEDAFLENLRKRYNSGLIYVSRKSTINLAECKLLSSQIYALDFNYIHCSLSTN